MNTPVKLELAKLLKEKGFDLPCRFLYKLEKGWEEGIQSAINGGKEVFVFERDELCKLFNL